MTVIGRIGDLPVVGRETAVAHSSGVVIDTGVNDAHDALAAVDAIAPHYLPRGNYRVASDLTLANAFEPLPAAIIKPDNGVQVTLAGPVNAGPYRWLDTSAGGLVRAEPAATTIIYPEWFGADPTGTDDSTDALNDALDMAIASNVAFGSVCTIRTLGTYKITDSLHGFSWSAGSFTFCSFHIEAPRSYITGQRGGVFNPTFVDRPCLILQAVRNTTVTGGHFVGTAARAIAGNDIVDDSGADPWFNAGSLARDSRYSPYCAIAIDPFSNGVPADGGIPGHAAFYTQNRDSSVVLVDGVAADGFIVDFAIGLGAVADTGEQQTDSITFLKCVTATSKVHYAIGQDQSRGVHIVEASALWGQTFVDTKRYGVGIGAPPVITGGMIAGGWHWIFNMDSERGVGSITGFYSESVFSLGHLTGKNPYTFTGCTVKLIEVAAGQPEADEHLYVGPDARVDFIGGNFGHWNNVWHRPSIAGAGLVTFSGTSLTGVPNAARMALLHFHDVPIRYRTAGTVYGISERYAEAFAVFGPSAKAYLAAGAEVIENLSATDYRRWRYRAYEQLYALGNETITANGDGTGSFTTANPLRYKVDQYLTTVTVWHGARIDTVADPVVSYAGATIGRVSAVNAGTGVVTLSNMPISFASGVYDVRHRILPQWRPRAVGTAAAGSAVVPDFSPTTMWAVGDIINSDRFPAGCYITAIAGSSVTLSQNATSSGVAKFYDAELVLEDAMSAAVPATGSFFKGDFLRNTGAAKDANNMIARGFYCTVSGRADGVAPAATFETVYESTVTPAM